MGVNPTQNLPTFPIVKTSTYPGNPSYSTAVQSQSDNKPSKDSGKFISPPVERRLPFEKGRLVNLYA